MLPDASMFAVVIVPVAVRFLNEAISLSESTTTALEAATVPAVTPSIVSNSASLIAAEPMVNPAAVMTPDAVKAARPDATSAEPSSTNALLAAPAPFVMPSSFSKSVSFITAEPIVNPVAVTTPPDVIAPSTSSASSMLIVAEASDLIGPDNVIPSLKNTLVESADEIVSVTTAADVNVPLAVRFLSPDATSASPSNTTALLAAPAPSVIPSIFSKSASLITADPIVNPAAVTTPDAVKAAKPDATFAELSSTNALFAAPAPFVMPSIFSKSVSLMSAEPIMNPVAVTVELNAAAPAADISNVNAVMPAPSSLP